MLFNVIIAFDILEFNSSFFIFAAPLLFILVLFFSGIFFSSGSFIVTLLFVVSLFFLLFGSFIIFDSIFGFIFIKGSWDVFLFFSSFFSFINRFNFSSIPSDDIDIESSFFSLSFSEELKIDFVIELFVNLDNSFFGRLFFIYYFLFYFYLFITKLRFNYYFIKY